MEIRIIIDAPKGWKRRVLMYVVTPVALVAGVGVAAYAMQQQLLDTNWVVDGRAVSAGQLLGDLDASNANFTELYGRVAALEAFRNRATADGGYSLGATYCGETAPTSGVITGSSQSGYVNAKALCQTACGGSLSAHMCAADEIVRSAQANVSAITGPGGVTGWYSAGVNVSNLDDCNGWGTTVTSVGSQWAPLVGTTPPSPNASACGAQHPILCCD